jgi:cellulose biosynthesis protein BcsQ/tetratricopeptide (TPR) repeat protein
LVDEIVIVTFYSYKGGTGRTMAMANIAGLLARQGKKVLVVDFDLEAPGLWRYFSQFHDGLEKRPGLIDLLLVASSADDPLDADWRDYVTEVQLGPSVISLITSGRSGDDEYPARVLDFDWTAFFHLSNGGEFVERLRNQWLEEYDFTFIDSRTGITDTGGICTIMLPDMIVPVFMSNLQSIEGVVYVIKRAQARRNNLAYDRPPALILPIMSRFDSRTEYASAQEWLNIAANRCKPFYADWLPTNFSPRQALERTKLPYVAYFSFGETMPALTQGTSDPDSLGYALNTVSQLIEAKLGNAELILGASSQDNKVIARYLPIQETTKWDFFLSFVQADRGWGEWIAWVLRDAGYRILIQPWDFVPGHDGSQVMRVGVRDADRTIAVWSADYLAVAYDSPGWQATWGDYPRGGATMMLIARVAHSERPDALAEAVGVDLFGISEDEARHRLLEMTQGAFPGRRVPARQAAAPQHGTMPGVRFPGSLLAVWNLPPHNPHFTGRGPKLGEVVQELAGRPGVSLLCVQGPAGVGKSQLITEYAHIHAEDYDVVWWISAGERASIPAQFAALLDLDPATAPEYLQAQIRDRLHGVSSWLLVFDDADAIEDIQPWLPTGRWPAGVRGHAIVTTRRGGFGVLGPIIDLDVVTSDEAVRLLQRHVPGLDWNTATQIGDELGRLPLALEQAAAYMNRTQIPAGEYLELLHSRAADLLGLGRATSREQTTATLWDSSLTRAGTESPATLQLLAMCAYLGPDPIPLDLFSAHRGLLPEPLSGARRLIQATIRARLDRPASAATAQTGSLDSGKTHWQAPFPPGRALRLTLALLHADAPRQIAEAPMNWLRWAALLPHVLAATGYLEQAAEQPDQETMAHASWLLNRAGTYLQLQARLADAAALLNRALGIDEAVFGPDHLAVADDLGHLAVILRDLKRPKEALPLIERALTIHESALGPDHPAVADDLGRLALILLDLKRPREARPHLLRALAVLAPDRPVMARHLTDFAAVLYDLGEPEMARPLLERAAVITEGQAKIA